MRLLLSLTAICSLAAFAQKPLPFNVITPEKAVCSGFSIPYKDHTTLDLYYPKTINKTWEASSVTVAYSINGQEAFINRVRYAESEEKPSVWIGFSDGFKQDHDARIDILYSCNDCDIKRAEFYSIESVKALSEFIEISKNSTICD